VQIMTYDIHGTWESVADFTAPLFDDNGKTYSVDKGVQAYLDAGVPAKKLVMGVPFYGYSYNVTTAENNGLRQPVNGSGSITYNSIVNRDLLNNGYERFWDEGSKVPYLFNKETLHFISHDDEESIGLKAEYIRDRGLGGAMIWELSQDHGNDLLATLYNVLKDPIERDHEPPVTTHTIDAASELTFKGKYTSDVVVTLSAEDDDSGVLLTEFSLNDGEWQTYTEPIVISDEGTTLLKYRSTDKAGNVEETKTIEINIMKPSFTNLYQLVQEATIHHGQKNALLAHIKSAENAKTDDQRKKHLNNSLKFVEGMNWKHIDAESRQDIV